MLVVDGGADTQGSGGPQASAQPPSEFLWLPLHGNVLEGQNAWLLEAGKSEFECRLCHFPAGKGARKLHMPPTPTPHAWRLACMSPVGSCPLASGAANGRHWQASRGGEESDYWAFISPPFISGFISDQRPQFLSRGRLHTASLFWVLLSLPSPLQAQGW